MTGPQRAPITAPLWRRLIYLARLGRPLHLFGGLAFNGLGIAIVLYQGAAINWLNALICQAAITAAQLMTHYSNEYFDIDADIANSSPTRWAGGSRVLPDRLLAPRSALLAAVFFAALTLTATAVLTLRVPAPQTTLFLLMLSLFLAWNYSSPPLWLNRRGLGEITAALLVPGLITLIAYQVQAGSITLLPILAALPICCFQFAMLLAVNFPDAAGDAQVNKRTLVVIFGPQRTGRLFNGVLALAYLSLPTLILLGLPWQAAAALLLTLPLAAWQAWRIAHGAAVDPQQWDALGFWSIGLIISAALLQTAVFLFLSF